MITLYVTKLFQYNSGIFSSNVLMSKEIVVQILAYSSTPAYTPHILMSLWVKIANTF